MNSFWALCFAFALFINLLGHQGAQVTPEIPILSTFSTDEISSIRSTTDSISSTRSKDLVSSTRSTTGSISSIQSTTDSISSTRSKDLVSSTRSTTDSKSSKSRVTPKVNRNETILQRKSARVAEHQSEIVSDGQVQNGPNKANLSFPEQLKQLEVGLKRFMKNTIKRFMPAIVQNYDGNSAMSPKCTKSLLKYIGALSNVKVWAMKMLDSTSKPPAGILEGTISDFGSFDQCLGIVVPFRNGSEEFRGSYCAIEATPMLPPVPNNYTIAHRKGAGPLDTIAAEFLATTDAFYFIKFRFGVCVPSACNVEDIRAIASRVEKTIFMKVKIPKCYIKEDSVTLEAVHIVVICTLMLLLLVAIAGAFVEKSGTTGKLATILSAFSIVSNYKRLISPSQGQGQLKALHGIRALSIAWVILGHSYVWSNFTLLRGPKTSQDWFNRLDMEVILNAWLSVESFFFLSGLLTCYACIRVMEKTKGKINIPIFIVRRYIRLTPPLLIVMGLAFFMPIVSSGPFWYENIDIELESCRKNWWTNILYISNWFSMRSICVHPTWYLSTDFQLHILSLIVLIPLYRSSRLGYLAISLMMLAGNMAVGILTYLWELPPIIQISSANNEKIEHTVDIIHMRTYTHIGPYCVGVVVGYLILKYQHIKLSKVACIFGWSFSFAASVSSIYGVHPWTSGHPHGPFLTCLYASLHRTAFVAGIGWVAFACVTGHAGAINSFLSSSKFAPLSRLTFTVYLVQSLVIWTRQASVKERMYYSNYNVLYEYIGNLVTSVLLAVPLYLLVESPVSNLDRLFFTSASKKMEEEEVRQNKPNGSGYPKTFANGISVNSGADTGVELKSVKSVQNDKPYYHRNGTK